MFFLCICNLLLIRRSFSVWSAWLEPMTYKTTLGYMGFLNTGQTRLNDECFSLYSLYSFVWIYFATRVYDSNVIFKWKLCWYSRIGLCQHRDRHQWTCYTKHLMRCSYMRANALVWYRPSWRVVQPKLLSNWVSIRQGWYIWQHFLPRRQWGDVLRSFFN